MTFILGLLASSPLNYDHNAERKAQLHEVLFVYLRRVCLAGIPTSGFLYPLIAWFFYTAENTLGLAETLRTFFVWYEKKLWYWLFPVGWWMIGFILRFYLHRYVKPSVSHFKRKLRITQKTDALSDIRNEKEHYQPKTFLPEKYYQPDHMFIGLDANEEPIYIKRDDWRETNMQVLGPTRSGKGVAIGNLIDQAIFYGDTVIYIDPKGDKFIPHIMADRAKKMCRHFYAYDLNDATENEIRAGEWAPFTGGDERARRARILTAFGLNDTGGESDFYKGRERKLLDKLLVSTNGRIPLLLEEFEKNADYQEQGQRLYNAISQWAKIKSLCPKKDRGLSIKKSLLNNAVIYVRGSMDDEIIREATRILVMEIVQEIKRLHHLRTSHVTLVIDEVRFLISNPLVDSLATIAGFNANVAIAYQAKNDVRNLTDRTLDAKSIDQSININCQLKLIYGSLDPETNQWAEEMSGERLKLVTRNEHTKVGKLGEETWENTRSIGQEKEGFITENTMLSLKRRVGILFQPRELAKVVFTSFVPTSMSNDFSKTEVIKPINEKITSEGAELDACDD
ncbi:MAG: type IV secretory system conjugative DNA transfer family protein [Gammaproteobacteria bacterium]